MSAPLAAAVCLGASVLGLVLWLIQWACTVRHLRGRTLDLQVPSLFESTPVSGISILKPLCGVDDSLKANLERFAELPHPHFELLLGVKDRRDPAYAIAQEVAERWPNRVRVVVQQGAPGYNPKVNQLLSLARAARHDLLVISDSNIRPPKGYLEDIEAHFADRQVGLVTHPVTGVGERTLGALLDNLYVTTAISPGMIAAQALSGVPVVVGKSMAMRRSDLHAMGGLESLKDVLAEDYVAGRKVAALGKRVVISRSAVFNVSESRSVESFYERFTRWGTMQRKAVGNVTYACQLFLNPLVFALAAAVSSPTSETVLFLLMATLFKAALEDNLAQRLGRPAFGLREVLAVPIKDAIVFCSWLGGLLEDEVCWRGNRLRVRSGTRLEPVPRDRWRHRVLQWLRNVS